MAKDGRAHWSGRASFILTAYGATMGMGGLWGIPYFVLHEAKAGTVLMVYLLCLIILGLPLFVAELFIGRDAQSDTVTAYSKLHHPKSPWRYVGFFGVGTAFLMLSLYTLVGGWILYFIASQLSACGSLSLPNFLPALKEQIIWHLVFVFVIAGTLMCSTLKVREKVHKILLSLILLLLFFLMGHSVLMSGFSSAVRSLFTPDFSVLSSITFTSIMGCSITALSLGSGVMVTYGSYLRKTESLLTPALAVIFLHVLMTFILGMTLLTATFTFGVAYESDLQSLLQALLPLFNRIPLGQGLVVSFLIIMVFALLLSSLAFCEVVIAFAEEKWGWRRRQNVFIWMVLAWLLSTGGGYFFHDSSSSLYGLTFFTMVYHYVTQLALPMGGALLALYFGWILGPKSIERAIDRPITSVYALSLAWGMRIIIPLALLSVVYFCLRQMF